MKLARPIGEALWNAHQDLISAEVAMTRSEAAHPVAQSQMELRADPVPERFPGDTSPGRWRALKLAIGGADVVAIAASIALASLVSGLLLDDAVDLGADDAVLAALAIPLWLATMGRLGLYRAYVIASRIEEFTRIARATVVSTAVLVVVAFVLEIAVSRSWIAGVALFAVVFLTLERKVVREVLHQQRTRGRFLRRAVVVGDNLEALGLCEVMSEDPYLGVVVIGFFSDTVPAGTRLWADRPVLGRIDDVGRTVEELDVHNVVFATTSVDAVVSNRLVRDLTDAGVQVDLSSSLSDIASRRIDVRTLAQYPILHVAAVRRHGWRASAKRTLDIVGSAALSVLIAPVLALAAIAIKVDSRGPVFFRQPRLGKDGRRFRVWKLRTMTTDAETRLEGLRHHNESAAPLFKLRDDPRVTRVGRFLRRYSIDELPQLWNVFIGQMSLVGPRPALPQEADSWPPELYARIHVRPGITGMWQIRGRSEATFEEYVRLDLYYVDNWSLWSDLAILAKTVPAVLSKRGAY